MFLILDTTTLILGGILLVFVLVATFTDVFLKKPKRTENPTVASNEIHQDASNAEQQNAEADELERDKPTQTTEIEEKVDKFPPLSIILTPHEKANELEQNLPLFLEQDYPSPFRVIVVYWQGESATEDVLKKHASNPHLYFTYISESSRYMSRKKLAITVGEKAATTEWLLLTEVTCRPQSKYWLRAMARHASPKRNLVIGHTRYDDDTPTFRRFLSAYTSLYLQREMTRDTAYRCESNALMFRRSEFEKHDGYRGNLKYLRGEYDFIVNEYARPGSSTFENSQDGTLIEQCPTNKAWRNKLLYYMENRRHLLRKKSHRWRYNLGQTSLHISVLAMLSALAYGCLSGRWLLMAWAALLLFITIAIRTWLGRRALQCMEEDIPIWCVFPYEMRMLWHSIALAFRYWHANKDDFITHKI